MPVLFLNTTLQNSTGKPGLLYCTNDVIYETEASSHHLFPKQQTLCLCISRWPRCTRGCCYRWSVSSPCSSPPPSSSTPGEGRVIFTFLWFTHPSYSHCRLYTLKTMMVSCAICLLFAQPHNLNTRDLEITYFISLVFTLVPVLYCYSADTDNFKTSTQKLIGEKSWFNLIKLIGLIQEKGGNRRQICKGSHWQQIRIAIMSIS